jgi:hypothetical protein
VRSLGCNLLSQLSHAQALISGVNVQSG